MGKQSKTELELAIWDAMIAFPAVEKQRARTALGKLEALLATLDGAIAEGKRPARLKQTLAGAAISLIGGRIHVDPAPPRRGKRA